MSSINRRNFLKSSAAGVAGVAGLTSASSKARAAGTPEKPNIIVVICDQMGIDAVSAYRDYFKHPAYNAHWINTPNLDRMVKNGYSFMNSFACNPVCSPDRAVVFTGRPPMENGVIDNNIGIAQNVDNMGQHFEKNSNYKRMYAGKWHAGGPWNCPNISGSKKIPGFDTIPVTGTATGDMIDPQVSRGISSFLRNYDGADPFLIVAGFMNPHDVCFIHGGSKKLAKKNEFDLDLPPLPPNRFVGHNWDYAFRGTNDLSELQYRNLSYDYCRMTEMLDTQLGRLLDAVESRPDADNTIVIFTSDHGEGQGRMGAKGKGSCFQYAMAVPLIFWSPNPNRFQQGILDNDSIACSVDIMKTVCDFAGLPYPQHCRGESLSGVAQGTPNAASAKFAYANYRTTGRVFIRRYDCPETGEQKLYKFAMRYDYSGNINKPYKLKNGGESQWIDGQADLFSSKSGKGLFNLDDDPWEMIDLNQNQLYASIAADMETRLKDYDNTLYQNDYYTRK